MIHDSGSSEPWDGAVDVDGRVRHWDSTGQLVGDIATFVAGRIGDVAVSGVSEANGTSSSGSVHLLDFDDDTVSAAFDGVDRQRKPRSSCLRAVSTLTAAATTSECNGSGRSSWICTT